MLFLFPGFLEIQAAIFWHEYFITYSKIIIGMKNSEASVQVVNNLIQMNNDRIDGYERAIKEAEGKDNTGDLISIFQACIDQSRQYKMVLGKEVQVMGGDIDNTTTTSGKLYRVWMDIKNAFTGDDDRYSILAACEKGEDAMKKAYEDALESDDLPAYLRDIVMKQKEEQLRSHDEIKALRDAAKV